MTTALYVVAFAGLLVAVLVVIAITGRRRFRSLVDAEVAALFARVGTVGPEQMCTRWKGLPDPVRRYLRYAIPDGAPALHSARLKHGGTFRPSQKQGWCDIEGEQYFTVAEPGFVWNATIQPAPLVWIEACDRLVAGRGRMLVKAESAITLADASGAQIDQGSTLRWLAECAWCPYAFIGEHVQWTAVDARRVRAMLTGVGLPVSAHFEFDEDGSLVCMRAERYRDLGKGQAVLTPWMGTYSDYRECGGFRIPTSVEVSWIIDGQLFSYARFGVTLVEYNVTGRFP